MTTGDPTRDINRLGYTEREAAFLLLVCQASGYFTRTQFSRFINREPGGLDQQLVDKLAAKHHCSVIQCSGANNIYHIASRELYSVVGFEDSTSRRLKSDEEITRRLLVLESCLRHLSWTILFNEDDKFRFFHDELQIAELAVPWKPQRSTARLGDSVRRFPVFVSSSGDGTTRSIKFLFADPGFSSDSQFQRYLHLFSPVFRTLGKFTLLYVSSRQSCLERARLAFERRRDGRFVGYSSKLFPNGVEHFLSFLDAERRWLANSPDLTSTDVRLMNEGEAIYNASIHTELRSANTQGSHVLLAKCAELGIKAPLNGTFEPQLVDVPRAMDRMRSGRKARFEQLDMQLGA